MLDLPHIDTLDEAIANDLASEEDRCGQPDCVYCYPLDKPDVQAFAEVTSYLNSPSPGLTIDGLRQKLNAAYASVTARGKEIELLIAERDDYMRRLEVTAVERATWESFFQEAAICVVALEDELQTVKADGDIAKELVGWWQQRALVLEAAVKNYAGHIWNDLNRKLKERENAPL